MASRHSSLQMGEIADITDMLAGFEEHNGCKVVLTVRVEGTGDSRTLVLGVTAWAVSQKDTAVPHLASVSVKCSALNLKHWNSAIIHALYALDFQLALLELGHAEPKS